MIRPVVTTLVLTAVLGMVPKDARAEFLDFTVNENSVPGCCFAVTGVAPDFDVEPVNSSFTADLINGRYGERLIIDGSGDFTAYAWADFNQFYANEGVTPVGGFLTTADDPNNALGGYNIYALFEATGSTSGGTFVGETGEAYLYIDPNNNTTFGFDAVTNEVALTNSGDDYLVLFTTDFLTGSGELGGVLTGGEPGKFQLIFENPTLTAAGTEYFSSFPSFAIIADITGDVDTGSCIPDAVPCPGQFELGGDVSMVFEPIPEPATLSLFGLGLAGSALLRRRRNRKTDA